MSLAQDSLETLHCVLEQDPFTPSGSVTLRSHSQYPFKDINLALNSFLSLQPHNST